MNGAQLEQKSSTKYLGVIFDKNLNWHEHIKQLNCKLRKSIGILSKISPSVPPHIARSLYFSFFQSHLNYNILNWGCATTNSIQQIVSTQNKAVKIYFRDFNTPVSHLYNKYNILPIHSLIQLERGKFMWKLHNNKLPIPIKNLFYKKADRLARRNRNFIPLFRTNLGERYLSNSAKLLWANIPETIKSNNSLYSFSKNYSHYLHLNPA